MWGIDHDTLHQQLYDSTFGGERRLLQALSQRGAQTLQGRGHLLQVLRPHTGRRELLLVALEDREALLQPGPAGAQFLQGEDLSRVGIDQARDLPLHLSLAALEILSPGALCVSAEPALLRAADGLLQDLRRAQHGAEVLPDEGIEACRGHQAGMAGLRTMP